MRRYAQLLILIVLFAPVNQVKAEGRWTTVLERKWVSDIIHADNGVTWVGTSNVYRYEDGVWTVYTSADMPERFLGYKVIAVDGETVWAGAAARVMKFDREEWQNMLDYEDNPYAITDLAVGPSGELWAGTEGGGLLKYDGETWTRYTISDDINENWILSLAVDTDGVVWAGSFFNGLYRFDGDTWTTYTTADGLAYDTVPAVLIGDTGIWCGTNRGVCFFSGSTWTTYTTEDGLVSDYVSSLAFGVNGDLWVAGGEYGGFHDRTPCEYTTTGGISHFENGVWTSYTKDDGLVRNYVGTIAVAPDGSVWCGTLCGCSIFTPDPVSVADAMTEALPLITVNGNYPNPANPTTTITYSIAEPSHVRLTVYSVSGQKVATLVDGPLSAGTHSVVFDGSHLASGVYFYRLESKGLAKSGKMLLIK